MKIIHFNTFFDDHFFFYRDGFGKLPPGATIEENGRFLIIRFKIKNVYLNFSMPKTDQCAFWGAIGDI